jgi:hypothetical protein
MSNPTPPKAPGFIVEDAGLAGAVTPSGQHVIVPKSPDGRVDERTAVATDPRERKPASDVQ